MNRRGFLGLLLSLPLLRGWSVPTAVPVPPPTATILLNGMISEGWISGLQWRITERIMTYKAPGIMSEVSRFVAYDGQWAYELQAERVGLGPAMVQTLKQYPRC